MGIGMVLGPGLGGWLAGYGLSLPYFLAGVLSLAALVIIYFVLPESLPIERRETQGTKVQGPQLDGILEALRGPIGFLMLLAFLIGLALAYFYERSGSLWPSMVLHGVNNAIGIAFIYLTISLA